MSRMQIYVFFDQPEHTYRCGDTVTGRIKVTALESTRIEKLKVTPKWRTHGRGNKAQGKLDTMNLFSGTWHKGETYEYFFSFETPLTPHSYEGDLINVDWFLHIHPDVSFELDDKLEEKFTLKPALENPIEPNTSSGCARSMPLFTGLFMLPFLGAGLFFLTIAIKMILNEEYVGIFIFIVAALFVAIPGFMLYKLIQNITANFILGGVTLKLEPQKVQPGNKTKLHIACKPRMSLNSLTIESRLSATEEATSGSGTSASTYTHNIFKEEQAKIFAGAVKAQKPFSQTIEFSLPDITPATLHLSSNSVTSSIHIKLQTDRFTWEGSQEIIVGSIE